MMNVCFFLGHDIACLGQGNLGQSRAYQLVNQYTKENDVSYNVTVGKAPYI